MPRWPATQIRLPARSYGIRRPSSTIAGLHHLEIGAAPSRAPARRRRSRGVQPSFSLAPCSGRPAAGRLRSAGNSAGRPRRDTRPLPASKPFSSTPVAAPFDARSRLPRMPIRRTRAPAWSSPVASTIVVRLVLLQHQPHAADIFPGVAPVALGIEIAEIEPLLLARDGWPQPRG